MKRLKLLFLVLAILMLSVGITLSACDFGGSNGNDGTEAEWNEKQYDLRMDYVFYDRDERHAMINQEEKTMPVQFAVQ